MSAAASATGYSLILNIGIQISINDLPRIPPGAMLGGDRTLPAGFANRAKQGA